MMPPPCAFTRSPAVSRKLTPLASAPEIVPTGPVQLLAPPPPFAPPLLLAPLLLAPLLLAPPAVFRPPSAVAAPLSPAVPLATPPLFAAAEPPPEAPLALPPSDDAPPDLSAEPELLPHAAEHSTEQHSSKERGNKVMALIGKRLAPALAIFQARRPAARFLEQLSAELIAEPKSP